MTTTTTFLCACGIQIITNLGYGEGADMMTCPTCQAPLFGRSVSEVWIDSPEEWPR